MICGIIQFVSYIMHALLYHHTTIESDTRVFGNLRSIFHILIQKGLTYFMNKVIIQEVYPEIKRIGAPLSFSKTLCNLCNNAAICPPGNKFQKQQKCRGRCDRLQFRIQLKKTQRLGRHLETSLALAFNRFIKVTRYFKDFMVFLSGKS